MKNERAACAWVCCPCAQPLKLDESFIIVLDTSQSKRVRRPDRPLPLFSLLFTRDQIFGRAFIGRQGDSTRERLSAFGCGSLYLSHSLRFQSRLGRGKQWPQYFASLMKSLCPASKQNPAARQRVFPGEIVRERRRQIG